MSPNVVIKVIDFTGELFANDIEVADTIFSVMLNAFLKERKVEIDFSCIEDISNDFLLRSFSKLYTRIGRENMRRFVIIKNADAVVFRKLKKMSEEIRARKNPL